MHTSSPAASPSAKTTATAGAAPALSPVAAKKRTAEQEAIIRFAHSKRSFRMLALAGTGKTSTLVLISREIDEPSLYLAFNNSIAKDARGRFPGHVVVKTGHALAYAAFVRGTSLADRIERSSWSIREAMLSRFTTEIAAVATSAKSAGAAFAVYDTLTAFMNSAAEKITAAHVPPKYGEFSPAQIVKVAKLVYQAMTDPDDTFPTNDDAYLKAWALTKPRLPYTVIFGDEWQDANPVMLALIEAQTHAQRIYVGDENQCLVRGSKVLTPAGYVPIESIRKGDFVMAAVGHGRLAPRRVTNVFVRSVSQSPIVTIRTRGGRTIRSTPEHVHFANFSRSLGTVGHHVYLMRKQTYGFRIGRALDNVDYHYVSGGFRGRSRSEHADRTWVLRVCDNLDDAIFHEMLYSLRYGIPTTVFNYAGRSISRELVDRIYREIDTDAAARTLFADLHMDPLRAHHIPKASRRQRLNFSITLCGDARRDITPMHRFSVSGSEDADFQALREADFNVRSAKRGVKGWRIEGSNRDLGSIYSLHSKLESVLGKRVNLVEQGAFVAGNNIGFQSAGNCHKNMTMVVESNGTVTTDIIDSVTTELYDGEIYDLNVEGVHNYVVDGVVTHNSIYSFRGAVNALSTLDALPAFPLTQSFRFGPKIATIANSILRAKSRVVNSPLRVRGLSTIDDKVAEITVPDLVLSRTNAGLFEEAVALLPHLAAGERIAFVGGVEEVVSMARAAYELSVEGRTAHKGFRFFKKWEDLSAIVENGQGAEFGPFVKLVKAHGENIPVMCDSLLAVAIKDEKSARVIFSTTHKFKGREHRQVKLAGDFPEFCRYDRKLKKFVFSHEEANIAYVAVTRAELVLDARAYLPMLYGSIKNIDKMLSSGPLGQTIPGR